MATKQSQHTFQDILDMASPALRPVCESLRRLIGSQHAGCVEIVWPKLKIASFGVGPKKMTQHYAYIAIQSSHVNLGFYHGSSLADPTGLLEGTGKALRHIKIRDVAGARSAAVAGLVQQAIAERRPYEDAL
ncbi:MAG: DUF1801 domain-containing protein [Rhodanobacter sp.]